MSTAAHSLPAIPKVRANRWSQLAAWVVSAIFVAGFFTSVVGDWTGPILGVWFVGTQKPRRGFFWMLTINLVFSLLFGWRGFLVGGFSGALQHLGLVILAQVLGILPFTFHRLVSPHLPGLLSTIPFPMAALALRSVTAAWPQARALSSTAFGVDPVPLLHGLAASFGLGVAVFFIDWFASTLVWAWNHEFRASRVGAGAGIFAAVFLLAAGYGEVTQYYRAETLAVTLGISFLILPACLAGLLGLTVWAILRSLKRQRWSEISQALAILQSPETAEPLHLATETGGEVLVSKSGERFPVRNGIPDFRSPEDLTGDNGKYNHLYETIGGFYDDTQRVFCAFRGLDIDSYFTNYMGMLEVKLGDSVLETSVGTGLNFKYLPQGVKLSGLDLASDMLTACQANLRRWGLEADLYLGNAERLPFADSSFDVVFHVGGISFFNDKAKAIREMIRVAKPGSKLLIEDETEEYAKTTYEKIPYTSSFYKSRKETVHVPIDLVPPEMEDIRLDMLKDGKFYAITFRKPAVAAGVEGNKIEA